MQENKDIEENRKRLDLLYKNSHKWLMGASYKITKDRNAADELVGELYLYLSEKVNPNIWYAEHFNLMYLRAFLQTRWLNRIKSEKRFVEYGWKNDGEDTPYDTAFDTKLEEAHTELRNELRSLETSKLWASAKLAEMYFFDDITLEKLAKRIKISKSTAFLNIKKIKLHLKDKLNNPFTDEERE